MKHIRLLVATQREVLRIDPESGTVSRPDRFDGVAPTSLASDPHVGGRAWCATHRGGVFRSDDGGATWTSAGLDGERVMVVAASPARQDLLWTGVEPSAVWRSTDGGSSWGRTADLEDLPSSGEWSFPPRPDTHHVRWIACHPSDPDRLWVAVEAGALICTSDGGRNWRDRVPDGPYDTHELAVHPDAPEVLRVAAGDGYYQSHDGGDTWSAPDDGLEVGYLRSVAIDPGDPEVVLVSAATHAHAAYVAGRSDGRVFRRRGAEPWERVLRGWPDPPTTIAPLLLAGRAGGELWAADERGVHRSEDAGVTWQMVAAFDPTPQHLRGLALTAT
ncbi:MAG TPA: hypothetical protein VMN78_06900 [Longimicrobiales bacterium]|nr:hypothetical protein [Longimicrobiales bacterium]